MIGSPYTCTEVTVDTYVGRWSIRLWLGTQGLVSSSAARELAMRAISLLSPVVGLESADEVADYAARNVQLLNAVQVRESVGPIQVGVMAYTQPFEDNDQVRFQ